MSSRVGWASIARSLFALGLLGACGKATSPALLLGETHWLEECGAPGDVVAADGCGSGLACSCGICTSHCTDDTSCVGGGADAVCAEPSSSPYTTTCAASAPERVCVPLIGSTSTSELQGRRYDERGCFHASESAGSRTTASPSGPPCGESVTFAHDTQGTCWLFLDTCLPDGFTEIPSTDPPTQSCTAVDDLCVTSPSCASDRFATSTGCLSCDQVRSALETRLAATKSQYDACSVDADCRIVPTASPCATDCGQAVAASRVDAYERAVAGFYPAYCTDPDEWNVRCQPIRPQCPASHGVCTAGHCVPITP